MGEYDSAIALARRLIKKKGAVVTLRGFSRAPDPSDDEPWNPSPNDPQDAEVDAVFLDFEQKYIDGSVILFGDQQVYMPAFDTSGDPLTPEAEGVVIRGGETWKIIAVKPLNPAGDPVMYTLQVRQ